MKFGVRECANIVFRAKQETTIGTNTFHVGQPVLYIDTATTSSMEQASTSVYAQGGRGNARLIAWEGDKTLTFTVTFDTNGGKVDLTDALRTFGPVSGTYQVTVDAGTDAPIFLIKTEEDGSLTGDILTGTVTFAYTEGKGVLTIASPKWNNTGATITSGAVNVLIDYYVIKKAETVSEIQITAADFAGYYYVEADTLFRAQATGIDMPANLTFPNVKVQSGFTISMAGTGDPSTFDFTMDAFPGYTYFDKTKQVLCVIQVVEDSMAAAAEGHSVMLSNDGLEHAITGEDSDTSEPSI